MDLCASVRLLFLLSVIGCCAGQDALPEGPVDVILGRNVTLKTRLEKQAFVVIIWNFNDGTDQVNVATLTSAGLKAHDSFDGRVSIDQTNGQLTITSMKSGDSGDYSISAVTSGGDTLTGEIKVRVLEPVSDVAIKSNLPEANEHNDTVVLTCSAKGSFLKFTWVNGTAPITADGKRITVKDEDSSSELTIQAVLRSDLVGPIICNVANSLETEKSAPFNLTVHYGPEEVTVTPANTPLVLGSGSNYSLTCSTSSSPAATFVWYHSEEMMEAAGPVLTLAVIEKHGLGKKPEEYTCRATNAKTQRVVSSPGISITVMDALTGVTVSGPTGVLIAGNSSANISCSAAAGTVESTTWLKDGKVLTSGSSRLLLATVHSSIAIIPVQSDDNGVYTCELSNAVSKGQASYKMVVNYGPEFAELKGPEKVEETDKVTLTCSAASVPPANFTWKLNGTVIDSKTATHVIEDATYRHSGTYTCEAHNAVTGKTAMGTHTLSVKEEGSLDGLSDGAIAGIVIGVLAAVALAIGLIFYCRQKVPVESPY